MVPLYFVPVNTSVLKYNRKSTKKNNVHNSATLYKRSFLPLFDLVVRYSVPQRSIAAYLVFGACAYGENMSGIKGIKLKRSVSVTY